MARRSHFRTKRGQTDRALKPTAKTLYQKTYSWNLKSCLACCSLLKVPWKVVFNVQVYLAPSRGQPRLRSKIDISYTLDRRPLAVSHPAILDLTAFAFFISESIGSDPMVSSSENSDIVSSLYRSG